MTLALQIALGVAVAGIVVFIVTYTVLTRGACWRDSLGVTLQAEALCGLGFLTPLLLASFFRLSVLGDKIGSWSLIAFIAASGLVFLWRAGEFTRLHRRGRRQRS